MKRVTLRARFILLISIVVFSFISIGILTTTTFRKIKALNNLGENVMELEIVTLDLRKNEKDFLARSIKDPEFFKSGESKYAINFDKDISKAILICEFLDNSKYIKGTSIDKKLKLVESHFSSYQEVFHKIVSLKKELGFKDWGLVGNMRESIHDIETIVKELNVTNAQVHMLTLRRREKDFLLRLDIGYKEKFTSDLNAFYTSINYYNISNSAKENIKTYLDEYAQSFYSVIDKYVEAGISETEGITGEMRAVVHQVEPEVAEIHAEISEMVFDNSKKAVFLTIIFISLGTLLSIVFSIVILNKVRNQLGGDPSEVSEIAENIASGNLNIGVSSDRIGVMRSMALMAEKLKEVISVVLANSEQILAASEQLSSTSEQISQGANEQASSVEEVSSTVEQINANIQQNTDNAQQTNQISIRAKDGLVSVNSQSDESLNASRTIADKIQIINDIAFQTNILALNAAVEAARAGEHGKGFAVVAAEVRKLAERSKVAADEIVQLAQSSLGLAEQAGVKLNEMLPEIEKTSQLIQEIAAASVEQNNGVNQVNSAIQQLSSVTQQNASASEEMASSSKELENQAASMKEVLDYFKLNGNGQKQPIRQISKKVPPVNTGQTNKPQVPQQPIKPTINLDTSDSEFETF